MTHDAPAYGLWTLVVLNSAVFLIFAFSFFKPRNARDWRGFGAFAAFVVALFVEMYGFPLTLYLLSGWLQTRYPGLDILSHDAGHLWSTIAGGDGNPHFSPPHLASYALLAAGFWLLSSAWNVLYHAQRSGQLATAGPYARVRHPQYVAFVLILFGFLLQWPTLLTLAMFPVLVVMYARLAAGEEAELRQRHGAAYDDWAARTPRFLPAWRPRRTPGGRYPLRFEAAAEVAGAPRDVFDALDDHRRLAAHMQSSSPLMAGASMALQLDDRHGQAVGSHIGLSGRVLGLALEVDEVVTDYERPRRKVWETVGEPRLLVIGRYRMGFEVEPAGTGSRLRIWIDYDLPERGAARWLGLALGRFYARWCTQQMLAGVTRA